MHEWVVRLTDGSQHTVRASSTSFDEHKYYFADADGEWIAVFPTSAVLSAVRSDSVTSSEPPQAAGG